MRHVLAALLIAVLTLAGVGRGSATASDAEQAFQPIAGVLMPICHSGLATSPDPGAPAHHDGCDQCALCAPVIFTAAPDLRIMAPVSHGIVRSAIMAWTVRLSRARTPRQSQGPPDPRDLTREPVPSSARKPARDAVSVRSAMGISGPITMLLSHGAGRLAALAPTLAAVRDFRTGTLTLEHAGTLPVIFEVEGIGAKGPAKADAAGHAGHSMPGMGMD